MSWSIVPLLTRDLDYFDRQRDQYSKWMHLFDDDWRAMRFDDSVSRFDRELERFRREMHDLDAEVPELVVAQPFVTDPEGNRKLSLRFNCDKFKPEEITVKTTGNVLNVHAKHEEDRPGKKVHLEFTRNYTLPKNVDPNSLKSTLSKDGVLQIEAPAPPAVEAPKENLIPIEKL
ncbi:HSPB1-like protein [Mya arenaria]|uniref:HSPB1-like protein n=1 Tax=Mya arenaria TaxID=6604 RepID=A0ABY7FX01_MYAAR|nr:heat shock protein 27-like [Mya arenaria]WAR26728.1 HSPB1-like protein [Mya arenaria]